MNTKIVAFGLVIALVLSAGIASAFSNSGGGDWKYYKEITIEENSGNTLSDYQVLVDLNPSNFPDKTKFDGSDLRFAEDGKEFSYWIEDYDAGAKTAKIWVKVPSIPASGGAKITMYYGNEKAGSVSDGDATFEFFDDFDGTSLDTSKWYDTGRQGTYKIHNGIIELASDTKDRKPKIASNSVFEDNIKIRAKVKPKSDKETDIAVHFAYNKGTGSYEWWKDVPSQNAGGLSKVLSDNKRVDIAKGDIKLSLDWSVVEIIHNKDEIMGKYHSEILKVSDNTYNYGKIGLRDDCDGSNSAAMYDWIFVTKYISPEPTITLSQEYPTPKISSLTLTKSASPSTIQEGETTTIAIRVENTGAGDAKSIEVTDTIPTGFKIISGSKSASFDKIKPGDYRTVEYTLKATGSGKFTCEPATTTYKDADGNSFSAASNQVSIQVGGEVPVGADSDGDGWSDEKEREMGTNPYSVDSDGDGLKDPEDPNPTVPEEKKTPGFEAVFVIAGLLAVAYLLRRRK